MSDKDSTRAKRASKLAKRIISRVEIITDDIEQFTNMIEMIDTNLTEDDLKIIRKAANRKIDKFSNVISFNTTSQREDTLKIIDFTKKTVMNGKHDDQLHLPGVELVKNSLSIYGRELAHKQLKMKREKKSIEGAEGKETGEKIAGVYEDQNFQLTSEKQVSQLQVNQAEPIRNKENVKSISAAMEYTPTYNQDGPVAKIRREREVFWEEKNWDLKMRELLDPELHDPESQDTELSEAIKEILKNASSQPK